MIFKYTLENVINGKKTQTRRLVQSADTIIPKKDGSVQSVSRNRRRMWTVGNHYSVQPDYGKKAVATIQITALRREPILKISEVDAIAERVASRAQYLELWGNMHGQNSFERDVWVIEFKLVQTKN